MMNNDQNSDKDIERLMAFKRSEKPSGSYFESFSDRVIARIEAEERLQAQTPWWRTWIACFDAKPLLALGYAASVMLVFFGGLSVSSKLLQSNGGANIASYADFSDLGIILADESVGTRLEPISRARFVSSSIQPVLRSSGFSSGNNHPWHLQKASFLIGH